MLQVFFAPLLEMMDGRFEKIPDILDLLDGAIDDQFVQFGIELQIDSFEFDEIFRGNLSIVIALHIIIPAFFCQLKTSYDPDIGLVIDIGISAQVFMGASDLYFAGGHFRGILL